MNYKVLLLFLELISLYMFVQCQESGDDYMLYYENSTSFGMDFTSSVPLSNSLQTNPVSSDIQTTSSTTYSITRSHSSSYTSIASTIITSSIVIVSSTTTTTLSLISSMVDMPHTSVTSSAITLASTTSISSSMTPVTITTATVTSIPTSITTTMTSTPTEDPFLAFFKEATNIAAVAGGAVIVILLLIICCLCCCYCCCRRRDKYVIEGHFDESISNGVIRTRPRPSISDPQQSYQMALKKAQTERQRIADFVETEMGEVSADDGVHYQGHSQVQHSQTYNTMETGSTMQSLPKLTPLNPSQILHQAHLSISVDDNDDDLPQRDDENNPRQNGGGRDSPFMHLSESDTLSVSRSKRSLEDNLIPESSQYSYLGLGVHHGSDVVVTNTASLMDDLVDGSVGMVGIDKALLRSRESDICSHRTVSPLLEVSKSNEELDDTPVLLKTEQHEPVKRKVSASSSQVPSSTRDFARLTSVGHGAKAARPPSTSTPLASPTKDPEGENRQLNLSAITSLKQRSNSNNDSDLQETPERQKSNTIATDNPSFRRPSASSKATRLGKLTSLEYIRASLRMKLKKMSSNKETENERKKPLKSALRKTVSTSSQHSTSSLESSGSHHFYSNRHVLDYSMETSPTASSLSSPQHYPGHMEYPLGPPDDLMFQDGYSGPGHVPHGTVGYPHGTHIPLSPSGGYGPELSPILSVSQFDHPHPMMYPPPEVGILPTYSSYNQMSYHDPYFPPHPPIYDDEDDDNLPALHSSYRNIDVGGASQSQRNVTWNLEPEEIPSRVELTPSSSDNEQV